MASLECPIICAVIGEGGSGGALALGVADRILMLEYSIYSVISPEGCASILWRDDGKKPRGGGGAEADRPRPACGSASSTRSSPRRRAARTATTTPAAQALGEALKRHLAELSAMPPEALRAALQKFRKMGAFVEWATRRRAPA